MWRLLCYITSILKSRLNMCGALKNFNMQFSGRLIIQTYIDTFVFFLPM